MFSKPNLKMSQVLISSATFIVFLYSSISSAARAPAQGLKLSVEDAGKVVSLLKTRQEFIHFCLPCGKTIGEKITIKSVEIKSASKKKVTVFVNNKPIDIAYVYLNYRKHKNKNLAAIIGLKTADVPTNYDEKLSSIYARKIKKMEEIAERERKKNTPEGRKALAEKWADIQSRKSVEILPDSPIK